MSSHTSRNGSHGAVAVRGVDRAAHYSGGTPLTRLPTAMMAAVAASVALCVPRAASGGCEHPCEMTVDPAVVTPSLPACVSARSGSDTCDCGAELVVTTQCGPVEALDASFCANRSCPSIDAGAPWGGSIYWRTTRTGNQQWTVHLRTDDGVVHAVTVTGNVTSIGGCACGTTLGAQQTTTPSALALTLLVALATLGRRRRARRTS